MKPSENLFDLIKCLSEKERNWVIDAATFHTKGEENKYLALFKEILAQEEYDEKALVALLGYQDDLNKFAFLKNYLYNFILSVLEDNSKSVNRHLHSALNQAEILINRKIYGLALEILEKNEAIAAKYQLFESWISILALMEKIPPQYREQDSLAKKPYDICRVIDAKNSYFYYRKLYSLARLKHHQTAFIRNLEETKEFKDVYEEELLEPDPNLNFHHKIYFYLARGMFYYAKKDYENSYIIAQQLMRMFEKYPWMASVRMSVYYNTYYNKALLEMNTGKIAMSIESLQYLKDKLNEMERGTPYQHYMLYNLWINILNSTGYYDKALKIVDEYREKRSALAYISKTLYAEQLYHFYLAATYFGTGDYKTANKHINEIINNEIDYNADITNMAYLLSLIIHFELEKTDIMIYRIKSVYRILSKRNSMHSIVGHVLDFLKDYAKSHFDIRKLNEKLTELKSKINHTIESDPIQGEILNNFDLISWINSKLERKPFSQVLKEKAGYPLG